MIKSLHKAIWAVLALIIFFFSLSGICGGAFCAPANVASDVLEDLQRDENFNLDDYPEILDDYSLNVIQIAESADGELFIYVYQPSGKGTGIYASSINIGRDKNDTADLSFPNYKLEYLNSSGVFYKYKVLNFELKEDNVRYYNISNILRPFKYFYDGASENDNKVSEVPYRVGQMWTAITVGDTVAYELTDSEVIEITQKYVGYVYLYQGSYVHQNLYMTATCSYKNFVAFSTDRPIDRLIQAEVQYSLCDLTFSICIGDLCTEHIKGSKCYEHRGEPVEQEPITLSADDKTAAPAYGGFNAHSYTWYNIQSTEEFLKDNNNSDYKLTTEGASNIEGTQWVLNFHKSDYTGKTDLKDFTPHMNVKTETVQDVMILRLMFETDGETYNLGVVDNKQTGGEAPVNYLIHKSFWQKISSFFNNVLSFFSLKGWFGKLLLIAAIVIALLFAVKLLLSRRSASKVTVTTAPPNSGRPRTSRRNVRTRKAYAGSKKK